ncbi:glycosyltransferase WbsX family protein [Tichowtungia aerotolerans]|uniref:Glycosyltransferase WbsX n=1 Tax=Tichowtungia aerotolerans TaxID=2697043 RepID=A0A6P1M9D1_9BACT|nr:glycoside hydrolase family 99-like domain-containing protein [Tichowtungia aerotolerans]QHI68688.1 hypothetical protein GT409_04245 [Tichowtungia aerotolerans]
MKPAEIAVYYFPNYHRDVRNETVHGPDWTEWELVRRAEPRFPGHRQPNLPAWGETDEADPRVMAQKIDAAADHGIDTFIFDWYWYNDGPFLQRGLDEGFLSAPNNDRLKFALMWANHDWLDIHPLKRSERPFEDAKVLYPGAVTPETFENVIDHCIKNYFRHPSYWRLDGCPYFSFYELTKLMEGFGSLEETRQLLDLFRAKVQAAGFNGLHLNAVVWDNPILPGETAPADAKAVVDALGFDSVTSYVWIHHYPSKKFPQVEYNTIRDAYFRYWDKADCEFDQPYYPNITMGWDSSPRTVQSDVFDERGYPFMYTIANNTPVNFQHALQMAKERVENSGVPHPFITVNAWNEWTEGSYLEPDLENGMGYLEAIRNVMRSVVAGDC